MEKGKYLVGVKTFQTNDFVSAEALPIMSRIRTFIHWKKWYYPSKCAFIFRLYVSCMGFPDCRTAIWLPDGVLEAKPTDSACEKV